MEKYKYGPLVYNIQGSDDDSGNFYWNGLPPVNYDEMGIPIDKDGNQCLDVKCPLHPAYTPSDLCHNDFLKCSIPSVEDFAGWFEENFIEVSEADIKFYILRWFYKNSSKHPLFISKNFKTEKAINRIWPDATTS